MEIKNKFRVPSVFPTSDLPKQIERFNNFACVPSAFAYFRHVKHDERNIKFYLIKILNFVSLKIEK